MGLPRTRRSISSTSSVRSAGDRDMRGECFQLRQSKASRSASARPSIAINGLVRADTAIDASANVMRVSADAGISHRVVSANMCGPRLKQIATLLYPHSQIVPDGTSESRTKVEVANLETGMRVVLDAFPDNDAAARPSPSPLLYLTHGSESP